MYEDGVMEEQASQDGIVAHSNVFRGSIYEFSYGKKYEGELSADSYTDLETVEYTIDDSWVKENITVFAVIWSEDADYYTVVNSAKLN